MREASIVGCGWVGLPLARRWVGQGVRVIGTTTRQARLAELDAEGVRAYCIDQDTSWQALPSVPELLVIAIPPGRKSPERVAAYPQRVLELAARASKGARVIFLSSTGVYGDRQGAVDEATPPSPTTNSARAVLEAEQGLFEACGRRLTVLRLAGLIGPGRHPGRWFAGKRDIPNGDAPVNLVHLDDVIDAIDHVARFAAADASAIFNVASQAHPTKREYYRACSLAIGAQAPTFVAGGASGKKVQSERLRSAMGRPIVLPAAHALEI